MKRKVIFAILAVVLVSISIGILIFLKIPDTSNELFNLSNDTNMKISNSAFGSGQKIPDKYTCKGEGISPQITISEIPEGTKSLVLIVDDPDAPSGLWTHWIVYNMNPSVSEILENSVPDGASQGKNSSNETKYGPPCPPSGTHRYFFRLYALNVGILEFEVSPTEEDIKEVIKDKTLAAVEIYGTVSK